MQPLILYNAVNAKTQSESWSCLRHAFWFSKHKKRRSQHVDNLDAPLFNHPQDVHLIVWLFFRNLTDKQYITPGHYGAMQLWPNFLAPSSSKQTRQQYVKVSLSLSIPFSFVSYSLILVIASIKCQRPWCKTSTVTTSCQNSPPVNCIWNVLFCRL